jgi:hypothetical protein
MINGAIIIYLAYNNVQYRMFGVIVCRNSVNLGDEIQSIAAIQQLQNNGIEVNFYCDRDTGDLYSYKDHTKLVVDPKKKYHLICSAWFDGNYCKWPLPEYIDPLFISFHVNETVKDQSYEWLDMYKRDFTSLTDKKYKDFYGEKSIGCRDGHTYRKFISAGYKQAYVSDCLTMTLSTETTQRKGIYLVDVQPSQIEKYVPREIMNQAIILSHIFHGNCFDEVTKYRDAHMLLKIYQTAELVITSRLHACLPCLAYDTPVLFHFHNMEDVRLKGLIDTVPVVGRDVIDYTNVINIFPLRWKSRVTKMQDTISEWIKSSMS